MLGMMHIKIEESEEHFRVNDVALEKRHIFAMFPDTPHPEKALAKYLAIVPFLADQGEHFRTCHKLSEQAAYGVEMAPQLMEAIGITEENTIPFMLVCFAQAGDVTPATLAENCRETFGRCDGRDRAPQGDGSNVIHFRPRGHTVH